MSCESSLSVHVDLAFRQAAVGGKSEDAVRFRLALLKAELVAKNPVGEGLNIIPESVARERTNYAVEKIVAQSGASSAGAAAALNASRSGLDGELSVDASMFRSRNYSTNAKADLSGIEVNHRKDSEGNHRWELTALNPEVLSGSGWIAAEAPRFSIRNPAASRLPRVLVFQVRCLREDLKITEIKIIPQDGSREPFFEPSDKAKKVAAEAYIKKRLHETGLVAGDVNDPFSEICLLETVVDV